MLYMTLMQKQEENLRKEKSNPKHLWQEHELLVEIMTQEKKIHNFGEKSVENEKKVLITEKYNESKAKAIEMIECDKYGLKDGDFWILKNNTRTGAVMYSGLIISHKGCQKINDALDNKVNPHCFSIDKEGFANSLVYRYTDDDVYEIGEVSLSNCKNSYPYAMAYKRCFDRVVLVKSKLAFAGIYSEVEADAFKEKDPFADMSDEEIKKLRSAVYKDEDTF